DGLRQQDGPARGQPFRDHRPRRRAAAGAWEDRLVGRRPGHRFRSHLTMDPAAAVMQRCDVLGSISEEPNRLTRPFASDAMRRAHEEATTSMREAGMEGGRDNIGKLRGRYEGVKGG